MDYVLAAFIENISVKELLLSITILRVPCSGMADPAGPVAQIVRDPLCDTMVSFGLDKQTNFSDHRHPELGWRQKEANASPFAKTPPGAGSADIAPLCECGSAVWLEAPSAMEGALPVEMAVDQAMNSGKFLQTS